LIKIVDAEVIINKVFLILKYNSYTHVGSSHEHTLHPFNKNDVMQNQ
jgi:hypothetical protein